MEDFPIGINKQKNGKRSLNVFFIANLSSKREENCPEKPIHCDIFSDKYQNPFYDSGFIYAFL